MNFFKTLIRKQKLEYWLSFFLPLIIFGGYFIARQIAPFGDSSILTVDLGQQYIDFLYYFKHNIFQPQNFIYTFSKGLGGSLLGTFTYYLASPFNFLLLLFSDNFLPTAIFIIILLKIGSIGLAGAYFFRNNFKNLSLFEITSLSLAYSLCGFVVANNFNLMWLDSVLLLPLILDQIEKLVNQPNKKNHLVLLLFITLFTNFYTGYMAVAFAGIYFLTRLVQAQDSRGKIFINYIFKNIIAVGLNAFLLLPTISELLNGKAQGITKIQPRFEFGLENLLAKLVSGSFDFKQMSDGMPNIYFGALFLIFLGAYFLAKQIKLSEKIISFMTLTFLVLSCSFEPLILLWHMGQFPVWYPGRFSFCLTLFCLILVARYLNQQTKSQKNINWKVISLFALLLITFVGSKLPAFTFLDNTKIFVTAGFLILAIILIYLNSNTAFNIRPFLLIITVLDLSINLIFSLNDISYQNNSSFVNFHEQVKVASKINHQAKFSRREKNFYRDDNDPISNQYFGLSNFDSVSDKRQIQFLNNLGLVTNQSSSSNLFSNIVTDSLLGVRYYLAPNYAYEGPAKIKQFNNVTYRPDFRLYQKIGEHREIKIYKNPFVFPMAFLTENKFNSVLKNDQTGRLNLANTLQDLNLKKQSYFEQITLPLIKTKNAVFKKDKYSPINKEKVSTLTYLFIPQTNNPYYLSLPTYIDKDSQTRIFVANHEINHEDLGDGPKLINIAAAQKNVPIKITIQLDKELNVSNLILYQFNFENFKLIVDQVQQNDLKPKLIDNRTIKIPEFTTTKKMHLQTLIPANNNWVLTDNNKKIKTGTWNDALLTAELSPGKHHLKLKYVPYELYTGLIISIISVMIYSASKIRLKKIKKNDE